MNIKMKAVENSAASSRAAKHPKVSEMVLLAIAILNERNGSSVRAIKKYISTYFQVQEKKISLHVNKYLHMAVASGTLIQTKGKGAAGSFRLGGCMKVKMNELLSRFPDNNNANSSSSTRRETTSNKNRKKVKKTATKNVSRAV